MIMIVLATRGTEVSVGGEGRFAEPPLVFADGLSQKSL